MAKRLVNAIRMKHMITLPQRHTSSNIELIHANCTLLVHVTRCWWRGCCIRWNATVQFPRSIVVQCLLCQRRGTTAQPSSKSIRIRCRNPLGKRRCRLMSPRRKTPMGSTRRRKWWWVYRRCRCCKWRRRSPKQGCSKVCIRTRWKWERSASTSTPHNWCSANGCRSDKRKLPNIRLFMTIVQSLFEDFLAEFAAF